jgi:hypothetical protein
MGDMAVTLLVTHLGERGLRRVGNGPKTALPGGREGSGVPQSGDRHPAGGAEAGIRPPAGI